MGLAEPFAALTIVFSAILLLSSGFYGGIINDIQATSDAVHGAVFVVFGLMGVLSALKLGFPVASVLTMIFLLVAAIGLTVELALTYTIYGCGEYRASFGNKLISTAQTLICGADYGTGVGYSYGVSVLAVPFGICWLAALCMLF